MKAQYDELMKKYKDSNRKYNESLENHSQSSGNNYESKDNLIQNDDNKHVNQNIEIDFITELKTSQIKGVHEKRLIKSFEEIITIYNDKINFLQKSLYNVKRTEETYKKALEKLKSETEDQLEKNAQETSNLNAENQILQFQLEKYREELELANRNNSRLIKKNERDMGQFLFKMEKEVEVVQLALKDEAAKKMEQLKETMTQERDIQLIKLRNDLSKLQRENTRYRGQIESTEEMFHEKVKALELSSAKKSSELKNIDKKLQTCREEIKNYEKNNKDYELLIEREKKQWCERFEKQKDERQQELEVIERKVTSIIRSKDSKIKLLQERAVNAEGRVQELENFFLHIEEGFVSGVTQCYTNDSIMRTK